MVFKSGWQASEELPMLAILFVIAAAAMFYWNVGTLEQKLATALLVSVTAVSLEVILTGKHLG